MSYKQEVDKFVGLMMARAWKTIPMSTKPMHIEEFIEKTNMDVIHQEMQKFFDIMGVKYD